LETPRFKHNEKRSSRKIADRSNYTPSHGRDSTLKVWQIRPSEEEQFSTALPIEGGTIYRKEPWLLHSLSVNTLNFCEFTTSPCRGLTRDSSVSDLEERHKSDQAFHLAVPGVKEGTVDIWRLPDETIIWTVPAPSPNPTSQSQATSTGQHQKNGMVMALQLLTVMGKLYLLTGWESGMTAVQVYASSPGDGGWHTIYTSTPHSQPILSLSILQTNDKFSSYGNYFTSAADSLIAFHTIPMPQSSSTELLFTDPEQPKVIDTKHAGQQSLSMRNDGKIFATAGWDGRVRVYSTKTVKELACLKWHREGIYAVEFAEIISEKGDNLAGGRLDTESAGGRRTEECSSYHDECKKGSKLDGQTGRELTRRESMEEASMVELNSMTVSEQRKQQTQQTHWLAAGSKDGKISLWDIY